MPPTRLRGLVSWQASRVAVLGTRLTLRRMPATARSDFVVLAALEEFGDLSQAGIGRHLGLDRNDVNGIVNRLAAEGQVTRRLDPVDRRRNIVTLTDVGRVRLEDLQGRAHEVQAELLAALTPEQQEQVVALLNTVLLSHGPQPG